MTSAIQYKRVLRIDLCKFLLDEIARDGGVKRALDHLLETVSTGDWSKYEKL